MQKSFQGINNNAIRNYPKAINAMNNHNDTPSSNHSRSGVTNDFTNVNSN